MNPTADNDNAVHRILVVDDNPSIHEDFRKILCPAGVATGAALQNLEAELFGDAAPAATGVSPFEMDSAFQGQEALAKVKAAEAEGRPYSMAFVDVRMPPGWDGVETISRIWQDHKELQVVICTAYSDYSWEDYLRKLGRTDSLVILKKPFDNVEVLQLAHALTKKWVMTREARNRMADLDRLVEERTVELTRANHHLRDEVERRAMVELALRESEERFRKSFETASVALAILRADNQRHLDANSHYLELTGYPREQIIGQTFPELSLAVDLGRWAGLFQSLQSGFPVHNEELELRRADQQLRQALVSIVPVVLAGQPCHLAALVDMTAHRKLEAQLRQASKMEAIGQLASGVAHDFNNLLTVIQGHASIQLAKNNLDHGITHSLEQVKMAAERAACLTRQLLAFSRKQVVKRRPTEVGTILQRVQAMLERLLGETIKLECAVPAELPRVLADESNLEQILLNLAVNARDAMLNGGTLRISLSEERLDAAVAAGRPGARAGHFLALQVRDTGTGMDTKTLARLFEPFFTTKPVGKGTGLGLSTVYGIVKQHEGWIEVESEPGAGSTFKIFLPVTHEQPEQYAHDDARIVTTTAAGETILVVEDEPSVRGYICSALRERGYRVEEASCGHDALSLWDRKGDQVQLVLTDMVMPNGISGNFLARTLLRRKRDLKVIYMSGYSAEITANAKHLDEGKNFLPKPFEQAALLSIVANAFQNSPAPVTLTEPAAA